MGNSSTTNSAQNTANNNATNTNSATNYGSNTSSGTAQNTANIANTVSASGPSQAGQALINSATNPQNTIGNISSFMSPYTQNVLNSQLALENQQNGVQQQQLAGNAISQGALGGSRDQMQAAMLAGQQNLANNATNAGILQSGYGQALQAAQNTAGQQLQGAGLAGTQSSTGTQQLGSTAGQQASSTVGGTATGQSSATAGTGATSGSSTTQQNPGVMSYVGLGAGLLGGGRATGGAVQGFDTGGAASNGLVAVTGSNGQVYYVPQSTLSAANAGLSPSGAYTLGSQLGGVLGTNSGGTAASPASSTASALGSLGGGGTGGMSPGDAYKFGQQLNGLGSQASNYLNKELFGSTPTTGTGGWQTSTQPTAGLGTNLASAASSGLSGLGSALGLATGGSASSGTSAPSIGNLPSSAFYAPASFAPVQATAPSVAAPSVSMPSIGTPSVAQAQMPTVDFPSVPQASSGKGSIFAGGGAVKRRPDGGAVDDDSGGGNFANWGDAPEKLRQMAASAMVGAVNLATDPAAPHPAAMQQPANTTPSLANVPFVGSPGLGAWGYGQTSTPSVGDLSGNALYSPLTAPAPAAKAPDPVPDARPDAGPPPLTWSSLSPIGSAQAAEFPAAAAQDANVMAVPKSSAAPATTPQTLGALPPAGAPASSAAPRGLRNNNPGNIEYGPFAKAAGAVGSDGRFAIFPSAEAGQAATDKLLQKYGSEGIDTVQGVIGKWAPSSENDTGTYANFVAKQMGVAPGAKLDMGDPNVRSSLTQAITQFENGTKGVPAQPPASTIGSIGDRLASVFGGHTPQTADKANLIEKLSGTQMPEGVNTVSDYLSKVSPLLLSVGANNPAWLTSQQELELKNKEFDQSQAKLRYEMTKPITTGKYFDQNTYNWVESMGTLSPEAREAILTGKPMPANPISSVAGPGATASSANVPAQAAAAGLTGDDYLKATERGDPNQKSINDYVRGVVAGTRDLPNVSDKNHIGFAINRRLDEAYPGVDKSLFALRRQTLKSFAPGGKDAQKNAALSQATEHGAAYVDAMENLHNPTGNTSINTAYNWIRSGNPFTDTESEDTFKARHNNAAQKANAFQEETGRVFKQVGPVTDSERKTLENMNNLNDPAGAQRAGIKAVFELYKGRFDTQADQYNKGAHLEGTGQEKTGLDFMSPQAMSLYLKVTGMPPAPKIGTMLKGDDNTNHRYVGGDPGNPNNWKAMQ